MTLQAKCTKCGGATRLVGIEPHHTAGDLDIWTLECTSCGHTDIEMPRHEAMRATAQTSRQVH
jgi:rRNA maturation protein Nop10